MPEDKQEPRCSRVSGVMQLAAMDLAVMDLAVTYLVVKDLVAIHLVVKDLAVSKGLPETKGPEAMLVSAISSGVNNGMIGVAILEDRVSRDNVADNRGERASRGRMIKMNCIPVSPIRNKRTRARKVNAIKVVPMGKAIQVSQIRAAAINRDISNETNRATEATIPIPIVEETRGASVLTPSDLAMNGETMMVSILSVADEATQAGIIQKMKATALQNPIISNENIPGIVSDGPAPVGLRRQSRL